MEQSPSLTGPQLVKEFLTVYYCLHKSLPPIPILSLSNLFLPTPLSEDIL